MSKIKRPKPPNELIGFLPAPEIFDWVKKVFFDENSKLYNPDHEHLHDLEMPELSFLWADSGFAKGGRFVLGQCEKVFFNAGGWKKARQEQQMIDWFGDIPNFLITLDANYCSQCSDIEFCALVEHELYHIAHAKDAFGLPAYNKDTGKPKLTMQGHDVEEFVGVVRRYGMSEDVRKLVNAANKNPEISKLDVAHACGTCLKIVA